MGSLGGLLPRMSAPRVVCRAPPCPPLPTVQLRPSWVCSSFVGQRVVQPAPPRQGGRRTSGLSLRALYYKLGRPMKRKKEFWEKKDERYKTVNETLVYWPYLDQAHGRKQGGEEGTGSQDEGAPGQHTRGQGGSAPASGAAPTSLPARTSAGRLTPTGRSLWERLRVLPPEAVRGFLRAKVHETVVTERDMAGVVRSLKYDNNWDRRAKVRLRLVAVPRMRGNSCES